jgi:hypothetical protein
MWPTQGYGSWIQPGDHESIREVFFIPFSVETLLFFAKLFCLANKNLLFLTSFPSKSACGIKIEFEMEAALC